MFSHHNGIKLEANNRDPWKIPKYLGTLLLNNAWVNGEYKEKFKHILSRLETQRESLSPNQGQGCFCFSLISVAVVKAL